MIYFIVVNSDKIFKGSLDFVLSLPLLFWILMFSSVSFIAVSVTVATCDTGEAGITICMNVIFNIYIYG